MTADSDTADPGTVVPATDGPALGDPATGRFMARQRRVVAVASATAVGLLALGVLGLVAALSDRVGGSDAELLGLRVSGIGAVVLGVLAGIALVLALAVLVFAAIAATAYARARRQLGTASWRELRVVVLPEDAATRRLRTVADTPDGAWRLVIAKPSAVARDQLTRAGRLWYAGELADRDRILVWLPAGSPVHTAGVIARSEGNAA